METVVDDPLEVIETLAEGGGTRDSEQNGFPSKKKIPKTEDLKQKKIRKHYKTKVKILNLKNRWNLCEFKATRKLRVQTKSLHKL